MSVDSVVLPGVPAAAFSDWRSAAQIIDHTLLQPEATRSDVLSLCAEAAQYGFHSVMVNPAYVTLATSQLHGSQVNVATVVGFPLGANMTATKLVEAEAALHSGARELDMVINIGALKSGDRVLVRSEIHSLAEVAHSAKAVLKVILENALLAQDEKILACALAMDAGADFVKTSTGFSKAGATESDVALMRGVVGHRLGVKAAGGIRTAAQMLAMLDAGANRIGTSAGVNIIRELGAPQ
jgi:deoxyribose-phosphate aldolase